jgi:hypothetical protein
VPAALAEDAAARTSATASPLLPFLPSPFSLLLLLAKGKKTVPIESFKKQACLLCFNLKMCHIRT